MSEAASTDPSVSFISLVVSLGSSALVHLGEIAEPGASGPSKNLQLARDTIDVLQVLKDKTTGNLDEDETKLLDALLFDLRTKYMDAAKG
jgi:hypothetical protein